MNNKPYQITALELGPMENFIYLIKDVDSARTAVIDPAWDVPSILKTAEQQGMRITDILLTHSHLDHINGVQDVLKHADAQLHLLKEEAQFWGQAPGKPTLHHGGDSIHLGQTEIKILHTPGHTPGSACYLLDQEVLTGDTLFVFGCGRCDLQGGEPEVMYNTLGKLQTDLTQSTIIYPGHNYASSAHSTMAEQIAGNPFMQISNLQDFKHFRMDLHDKLRNSPYGPQTPAQTAQMCHHS